MAKEKEPLSRCAREKSPGTKRPQLHFQLSCRAEIEPWRLFSEEKGKFVCFSLTNSWITRWPQRCTRTGGKFEPDGGARSANRPLTPQIWPSWRTLENLESWVASLQQILTYRVHLAEVSPVPNPGLNGAGVAFQVAVVLEAGAFKSHRRPVVHHWSAFPAVRNLTVRFLWKRSHEV